MADLTIEQFHDQQWLVRDRGSGSWWLVLDVRRGMTCPCSAGHRRRDPCQHRLAVMRTVAAAA